VTTTEDGHLTRWVPDDSTFGARLALIRQRMGWGNVKEAAMACGLPVESWRNWERDGAMPRRMVEVASVIADRTGCDLGWLLAGSRLRTRDRGQTTVAYPVAYPGGRAPAPSRPAGPRRAAPLRPPVIAA
jgi:hypothetical protein